MDALFLSRKASVSGSIPRLSLSLSLSFSLSLSLSLSDRWRTMQPLFFFIVG